MTSTISRRAGAVAMPRTAAPAEPNSRPARATSMPEEATPDGTGASPSPEEATSRPAIMKPIPNDTAPGGTEHVTSPVPPPSRPAVKDASPNVDAPGGNQTAGSQMNSATHQEVAAGTQHTSGQEEDGAQTHDAVGDAGPDPAADTTATSGRSSLLDPALALAADVLDDIERVRTANENRLRQMTRSVEDSDGLMRGFGYDETHPDVARLAAMVDVLRKVEHDAVLQLQRQMRRHALGPWVKATKGVGEKQAARLLASIGDPYWRPELAREDGTVIPAGPRTVSALWAYCGLHVLPGGQSGHDVHATHAAGNQLPADHSSSGAPRPRVGGDQTGGGLGQETPDAHAAGAGVAAKRRRGERANWSTKAKTRAYLIAESCLKQISAPCHAAALDGSWLAVHYDDCRCSPYRVAYDRRRMHTATSHPDWTDGHSHQDALRVASKEILKDLWRAAREIHGGAA